MRGALPPTLLRFPYLAMFQVNLLKDIPTLVTEDENQNAMVVESCRVCSKQAAAITGGVCNK